MAEIFHESKHTVSSSKTTTLRQPNPSVRGSSVPSQDRDVEPMDMAPRWRRPAFIETGLSGEDPLIDAKLERSSSRQGLQVRFRSKVEIHEPEPIEWGEDEPSNGPHTVYQNNAAGVRGSGFNARNVMRLLMLALLFATTISTFLGSPFVKSGVSPIGAKAGPIDPASNPAIQTLPEEHAKRANSPTDVCTRWSQQTAVVNNTMYIYGGRATTQAGQDGNTWNNDFLTLDLSKTWQISSPSIQGLPQPSGPPPVANGFLWHSESAIYLYGGEFSDNPVISPVPFSMWSYDIPSSSWSQQSNPQTSAGEGSDDGNQPVQRAAEGAGITVPSLGRGYYFGGHLDGYTTAGWSQSIARVYLTSLLEFTFPGQTNPSVNNNQAAGPNGLYRNITQGGLQDTAGFPERADGVLVYIPGFGADGIILGLAGGTNATFTQMNIIDVYDVSNSTWYKQTTNGKFPEYRVNPCAVVQSAPDGSSLQVYMFGGQNLLPYGNQTQYSDMWILTIPSFTWIEVNTDNQAVPPARAGHTCDAWNSQMIVVGGYVGQDLSCDAPGMYVFNTTSLQWQNSYNALEGGNNLNQQQAQEKDFSAISGSYGYEVPGAVQSVIGGNSLGGATVTAPAQSATQGPFATGKPSTYTVTQSGGSTVTETAKPGAGSGTSGGGSAKTGGGVNVGAIVAGIIASLFAILAAYLGFCAWLYRRQLALYKKHVAMAQTSHLGGPGLLGAGVPASGNFSGQSTSGRKSSFETHSNNSGQGSGTGSGSGLVRMSGSGYQPLSSNNPLANYPGTSTANSSTEDLMAGQEPSFLGVVLNPRRSLRVVNRD